MESDFASLKPIFEKPSLLADDIINLFSFEGAKIRL